MLKQREPTNNLYFDNVNLCCRYAQSESGCSLLTFFLDKAYEKAPAGKSMVPKLDVCLQDENGNPVEQGKVGEICYKQPYFRGYVNLPKKNETIFRNGYIRSGDLAKVLPDGNFLVLGRVYRFLRNRFSFLIISASIRSQLYGICRYF